MTFCSSRAAYGPSLGQPLLAASLSTSSSTLGAEQNPRSSATRACMIPSAMPAEARHGYQARQEHSRRLAAAVGWRLHADGQRARQRLRQEAPRVLMEWQKRQVRGRSPPGSALVPAPVPACLLAPAANCIHCADWGAADRRSVHQAPGGAGGAAAAAGMPRKGSPAPGPATRHASSSPCGPRLALVSGRLSCDGQRCTRHLVCPPVARFCKSASACRLPSSPEAANPVCTHAPAPPPGAPPVPACRCT